MIEFLFELIIYVNASIFTILSIRIVRKYNKQNVYKNLPSWWSSKEVWLKILKVYIIILPIGYSTNYLKEKYILNYSSAEIQVGYDDQIDQLLFNYVKYHNYSREYIFQEETTDEYGNKHWVNNWIINDLSIDEYNEMRKYEDYIYYYDNVLKGSNDNKKYTLKKIK